MKLSDHFTLQELTKSQTATRLGISNTPDQDEVDSLSNLCSLILEPVREEFGIPFSPSSGYRSSELNSAIGSKNDLSQHCLGEAADIEVPTVSNLILASWIKEHLDFDQLILEYFNSMDPSSGWVHVSCRPDPERNRGESLTYDGSIYRVGLPIT